MTDDGQDPPSPQGDPLAILRDPATARLRCAAVARAVERGDSGWFTLDRSRLQDTAERVAATIRRRHPDLAIPPHSRWRHFEAGGIDRKAELDALLQGLPADEQARARLDLTVVSVLLDAGAGSAWRYDEARGPGRLALPVQKASRDELLALLDQAASGQARPAQAESSPEVAAGIAQGRTYSRSEGLAVACFRAFVAGAFSADPARPCRVDASVLRTLDAAALRAMFQAGPSNPLIGLDGRAGLLARLGHALQAAHERDGSPARPSALAEVATAGFARDRIDAGSLLREILGRLAPVWAGGAMVCGQPAGDAWPHRWAGQASRAGRDTLTGHWVPFHQPEQWLAYSMVEPLAWAGVQVTHVERLTGLPDIRNGGLMLDCGVIVPRAPADLERTWAPGDEFVVEWRALTLTLLDELAPRVRQVLGVDEAGLPMDRLLEGGTWHAGCELAAERRDGAPPVRVAGDGTLF